MKKLLAIVVAVMFFAAFSFAQNNEAYINQVGATNTSNVDQTGTTGGNTAYVNQYGSNIGNIQH